MRKMAIICCITAANCISAASAFGQDRFPGAVRVEGKELQRILPGSTLTYEESFLGRQSEWFGRGQGAIQRRLSHRGTFYSLRIVSELGMGFGSYRVHGNLICSIVSNESLERCRSLFRLPGRRYALSDYDNWERPSIVVQLSQSRPSER